jgi:hypothetical protein
MSQRPDVPAAIAAIAPDGNLTARQRRHFIVQRLVQRSRGGTGSARSFLRRRTAMHAWPDLRKVLRGIPWAIVGGVATRAYMPERVTQDMDILVHERDGAEAVRRMGQAGFSLQGELAIPGYALRAPDGVEVDVLLGAYAWLEEALAQPELDAAGYPVIGLQYLVLLKLQAERSQDWADVSRMLGQAGEAQLDRVLEFVQRHSPEDVEDLQALIFLGKKEMETPPKRPVDPE